MDLSGVNNLMQNRLFQSALLSTGASLNPQGISPGLSQTLQPVLAAKGQAVTNKYYLDILRDMLAKGGDLKMNADKFTYSGPSRLLGESGELEPGARIAEGLGASQSMPQQQANTLNPFR